MTLIECWNELLAMVPDTVDLHLEVSLHRYPRSHTREPRIIIEFSGWGAITGRPTRYMDAESCEQLVQKFRAVVMPQLGLAEKVDVSKELDCEVELDPC